MESLRQTCDQPIQWSTLGYRERHDPKPRSFPLIDCASAFPNIDVVADVILHVLDDAPTIQDH